MRLERGALAKSALRMQDDRIVGPELPGAIERIRGVDGLAGARAQNAEEIKKLHIVLVDADARNGQRPSPGGRGRRG